MLSLRIACPLTLRADLVRAGRRLVAIEVKSGRTPQAHPGLAAFAAAFKQRRTLLVGDGIAIEEFLAQPAEHWLRE